MFDGRFSIVSFYVEDNLHSVIDQFRIDINHYYICLFIIIIYVYILLIQLISYGLAGRNENIQ